MRNRIDLGVFWKTFEQILIENGEPFKIVYNLKRLSIFN